MVAFIYNNMTKFPFEFLWPITGEQFEAMDHDQAIKFTKVHAGRQWQAIIQCYHYTKQAQSGFWKAALDKMAKGEIGRGLFDLNSFVNVHGYESLNEGLAEETGNHSVTEVSRFGGSVVRGRHLVSTIPQDSVGPRGCPRVYEILLGRHDRQRKCFSFGGRKRSWEKCWPRSSSYLFTRTGWSV